MGEMDRGGRGGGKAEREGGTKHACAYGCACRERCVVHVVRVGAVRMQVLDGAWARSGNWGHHHTEHVRCRRGQRHTHRQACQQSTCQSGRTSDSP